MRDLLSRELDWFYLIRTVLCRGTLPLLYHSLSTTCPDAVPRATLEQLRRQFEANARRNAFLTSELLRMVGLLEAGGIPAIPFKGPVLAELAYGDGALRQFADLDILVREGDALAAYEIFAAEGYRRQGTPSQVWERAAREHDFALVHPDSGVGVELHWSLALRRFPFLSAEDVWDRSGSTVLAGWEIRTLRAEDLLLFLCIHGSKHCWERLSWISDVAELVRAHPGLDWHEIVSHARRMGALRMLYFGLNLADELLSAPLPAPVARAAAADRAVRLLAHEVRESLFCDPGSDLDPFSEVRASDAGVEFDLIRIHLRMRERLRDRLREGLVFARLLAAPTDRDRACLSLPNALSPLYYLVRPLRLTKQYGAAPVRFLYGFVRDLRLFEMRRR
jgi:hypothetical protein